MMQRSMFDDLSNDSKREIESNFESVTFEARELPPRLRERLNLEYEELVEFFRRRPEKFKVHPK
jgi:hypothetical protein